MQLLTPASDYPATDQGVPFLSSINLPEWLTEPRETFYLLYHWFIIKGIKLRTGQMEEMLKTRLMEGAAASKPPGSSLPAPWWVHHLEALRMLSFAGAGLWRLHYTDTID